MHRLLTTLQKKIKHHQHYQPGPLNTIANNLQHGQVSWPETHIVMNKADQKHFTKHCIAFDAAQHSTEYRGASMKNVCLFYLKIMMHQLTKLQADENKR